METDIEDRIAQEVAAMRRDSVVAPAPTFPSLQFVISHPGVDIKSISPQAMRRFVQACEATLIAAWFPRRESWPSAATIKTVELQIVSYETKRSGTATASTIADAIRRKLCCERTAVEVISAETRPWKGGSTIAARIVVSARVTETQEPAAVDGYEGIGNIRQADGFDNVGTPCLHRDEDACRIKRCAWIMPGSQMPADPDPLEVKAEQIERVIVERDDDPPSVLHADDSDSEYMAVKGWLHGPMRHDVDLQGGSSSKGRVRKEPKPLSAGERAVMFDGQIVG